MKIFTLGTSTREKGAFLSILKSYGIEYVCDVRRFPLSRFFHFNRDYLERYLTENGINYVYLGDLLGGYRRGGFESYMKDKSFEKGIDMLIKVMNKGQTCIVCAERFPWRCHRKFIAIHLEKRGIEVIHIIDLERLWRPLKKREKDW